MGARGVSPFPLSLVYDRRVPAHTPVVLSAEVTYRSTRSRASACWPTRTPNASHSFSAGPRKRRCMVNCTLPTTPIRMFMSDCGPPRSRVSLRSEELVSNTMTTTPSVFKMPRRFDLRRCPHPSFHAALHRCPGWRSTLSAVQDCAGILWTRSNVQMSHTSRNPMAARSPSTLDRVLF